VAYFFISMTPLRDKTIVNRTAPRISRAIQEGKEGTVVEHCNALSEDIYVQDLDTCLEGFLSEFKAGKETVQQSSP